MKIAVRFITDHPGPVTVRLTVVDAKGFFSRRIFQAPTDYPSLPGYQLSPRRIDTISNHFSNMLEAQNWATDQIIALRQHYYCWYEDSVTQYYEVTL